MTWRGRNMSRSALVLLLYSGLAAGAVGWAALRDQPNVWRIPGRDDPLVITGILLGLMLGLALVLASRLCLLRFRWARALNDEFRTLLTPITHREIVVLAVASSIAEEMFFRGAMLPVLGVLGSSVVFALLHVGPKPRYLPWTATSFLAGLLFGQLFLWTGDLTGAVVAHFTVNYLNLRHIAGLGGTR
jgi:uncharacterized protein